MSNGKTPLAVGVSGSNRTPSHTVKAQRLDVHIYFVQPGGEAKIVASVDNTNWAPYVGIAPFTTSGAIGLDVAEDTYIAVEYSGVVELDAHVLPYNLRQI